MLLTLRRGAGVVAEPDAVDLLLACHQRIRHFTQVAAALADAPDAPPAEVAAAAVGVLRYFTEALPLHAEDEDASVAPRLLAAEPPAQVRVALESMTREHGALDEALAALAPRWRAVAFEPGRIEDEAPELRVLTARLAERWAAHLAPEEAIVFPAMRSTLSPGSLHDIVREMRARRGA